MTTRWKQKASLAIALLTTLCILLLLIILWSAMRNGMLTANTKRNKININEKNLPMDTSDNTTKKIFSYTTAKYLREEFVRPLKVHNLPLHADDLLYESKKNSSVRREDFFGDHGITGNYRNISSRIWDPHAEYIVNAFGHRLHLILHQDAKFIPGTLKVTHVWLNRTEQYQEEDYDQKQIQGCFYKGFVKDDDKSVVSVSLCNGMRGHIWTTFGSFFIEPIEEYSSEDSNILHKIQREGSRFDINSNKTNNLSCLVDGYSKDNNEIDDWNPKNTHERQKRSTHGDHQFTLEVLIAVDRKMQEFHGSEIKSYILTLMSIVSNIFSDASIGNYINVAVINIMLLRDDLSIQYIDKGVYASHLLKRFCSFMQSREEHYDTAILLTREQICRNTTETKCDTLGLAELGTVCKRHSCSIVQDNGLPAAFTIAHELGHILNMPHDDDSKCEKFRKHGKRMLNIMSSTMGDEIHPWSWSDCSRHYVSEFLEKLGKSCMLDARYRPMNINNKKLPGELYSLDQQCELIHGTSAKYCNVSLENEKECGRLWCFERFSSDDCRSSNLPWADGTMCRDNHHWCQKGSCVHKNRSALKPIEGGWGPWSLFSSCSRTCGGGIQESTRECNNPIPANGGKYCIGKPKEYRSCNTQDCPNDTPDFREQQCSALNNNNLNIQGIDKNVNWVPKYGVSLKDECKLFCRVEKSTNYFQLADKVVDGTTCSFDSFNKCVNGICRPAGCDNVLYSDAKLDRCGVCNGNNDTCNQVKRNIYRSDIKGKNYSKSAFYFSIVTIPKGSANIEISQPGYPIENYIVLLDYKGEYLLNGNKIINTFKKTFAYAGVTFEYSGANSTLEKVNTTYSRKLKRDLIVEILSLPQENQDDDAILLTYSYITTENQNPNQNRNQRKQPDIYQWKFDDWTPCDSICQGSSHMSPVCVKTDIGQKVPSNLCDIKTKPNTNHYRVCNTECDLIVIVQSISSCSAQCGKIGTRSKTYTCVQKFITNNRTNVIENSHCKAKSYMPKYEDCQGSCAIWNYTDWTSCSRSCGTGTQTRSIVCLTQLNGSITDDINCSHLSKSSLKETIRPCNTEPCPAWAYEEILSKSRYPISRNSHFYQKNPNYRLKESNFRNDISDINPHYNNPKTSAWAVSDWGTCQNDCYMNRTVYCQDSILNNCPLDKKPSHWKHCCKFEYIPQWSACSVKCGHGERKRYFECYKVINSTTEDGKTEKIKVELHYCRHLKKRPIRRPTKRCRRKLCNWKHGQWLPCSAQCDKKFTSRNVTCANDKGKIMPDDLCDAKKKPTKMKECNCNLKIITRYSSCSCEGYQKRRYFCYNNQGRRLDCNKGTVKLKCEPPRNCFKSCRDVQKLLKTSQDKEYTIMINNKPKKIYCHNMRHHPKEYISLPSKTMENYSVYSDKVSGDPSQCVAYSYNSTRILEAGYTRFEKIRIDINNLRVIEDDYTFAKSRNNPQPFASAGDCNNRAQKCPEGYFSINLTNTGFKINPKTEWQTIGSYSVVIFDQELKHPYTVVKARCGGFCGKCYVSRPTGLMLDVL